MIPGKVEMSHIPPLNKPVSGAKSASLPWQITALIVLGVTFSLTRFVAAQDTTPPARFELLVPKNNATTYATVYGHTPLLAWRASSDSESGIAYYEVWLDGEKVDDVPAGLYGHLPGGSYGNYEPFRPFGVLAEENVCYYTPLLSKVAAGAHQWYVKAVDGDGHKRQSDRVFNFTVEEFGATKVFVNHLGYLSKENKRVVVDGSVGASSFDVVDVGGTVVFSGDCTKPTRPKKPSPTFQSLLEPDDVDRPLRPNEIERTVWKRWIGHVCFDRPDPLRQPFTSGSGIQLLQKKLANIYRRDVAQGGPGQDQRCRPCTASEIDNARLGRQPAEH